MLQPSVASKNIALVIDGKTLTYALDDNLQDDFLKLCQYCRSVLCVRVTPFQKVTQYSIHTDANIWLYYCCTSQRAAFGYNTTLFAIFENCLLLLQAAVVKLVKDKLKKLTLAIGKLSLLLL